MPPFVTLPNSVTTFTIHWKCMVDVWWNLSYEWNTFQWYQEHNKGLHGLGDLNVTKPNKTNNLTSLDGIYFCQNWIYSIALSFSFFSLSRWRHSPWKFVQIACNLKEWRRRYRQKHSETINHSERGANQTIYPTKED
jgi:hypothetical protein